MVVRLRLSRFGCRNKPFYRLMAADSRSPRDGKHLVVLGYYKPLPGQDDGKRMGVDFDRVKLNPLLSRSTCNPIRCRNYPGIGFQLVHNPYSDFSFERACYLHHPCWQWDGKEVHETCAQLIH